MANVLRKILFFPLTRMFIAIFAIVGVFVLEICWRNELAKSYGFQGRTGFSALSSTIMIVSVCLVYAGYVRIFERRKTVELSSDRAVREFAAGSALGFGLHRRDDRLSRTGRFLPDQRCRLVAFAGFLVRGRAVAAFLEEIIIRGIVFRITEESLGTWLAMIFPGLLRSHSTS